MQVLRDYQAEASEKIYGFVCARKRKATICIATGLGKTAVIAHAIQKIRLSSPTLSVAVLASRRSICEQTERALRQLTENMEISAYARELKPQSILVTTYQDVMQNQLDTEIFDLVICDEAQFLQKTDLFSDNGRTKYLGVTQSPEPSGGAFHDAECLFSYTLNDAVRDGYELTGSVMNFIQHFLIRLLEYRNFTNIVQEAEIPGGSGCLRADIIAEKDRQTVVIEVKTYRSIYNSSAIIDNALKQVLRYKQAIDSRGNEREFAFIVVMPCEIADETQKEVYARHHVIIWSINNLIYLCDENKELLHLLMSRIPFPSFGLKGKKPLDMHVESEKVVEEACAPSATQKFQDMLSGCKPGKVGKADKKYEAICSEIIKYLFATEFYQFSTQHRTEDELFRMDLLCSLKGSTAFWQFLMTFYHTKFVVFEYKNYSSFIAQNLIYITEKYLFPIALRNVAFIISRKGFDANAQTAAIGCLRESGKLIVDLQDDDLIKMVSMKENGEEPSDYLMSKVEDVLMSIGK